MNEIIKSYFDAGLSLLPVRNDKKPLNDWMKYKISPAIESDYGVWSFPIGCIGGKVSGGLVCIDFDDAGSCFKEWGELVKEQDPNLIDKIVFQRTPSGGYHAVYRCDKEQRNEKLAMASKDCVLIETRGEGGYFLIAPSEGYKLLRGDFTKINKLTEDEHEILITTARRFNKLVYENHQQSSVTNHNGITPFDDYDAKHNPIDMLCQHGWNVVSKKGEKIELCRPGKTRSVSATWNYIKNRLYVFTTSTIFSNEKLYKPSAVYAILCHNGDFVSAAKELYAKGFGERIQSKEKQPVIVDTVVATKVIKASDFLKDIITYYAKGLNCGKGIGIPSFDNLLRFDHGQLNIITGIPTHGKSEWLDFMLVQLAKEHKWNTVFFSPENYPLSIHFNKLAEKYMGISMHNRQKEIYEMAIEYINDRFRFIDATEEDLTLDGILNACLETKNTFKIDCLVIDPWNEIEASRPREQTESEFTGNCLRKLRKFARKNGICIFVVAHPTKMQKIKDTEIYPVPSLWDICGSSNWYNKADNGIVVYRDMTTNVVDIHVKKVKFKNYGELGVAKFTYNKENGCYIEYTNISPVTEEELNRWN